MIHPSRQAYVEEAEAEVGGHCPVLRHLGPVWRALSRVAADFLVFRAALTSMPYLSTMTMTFQQQLPA
jgi:hypothetical protein